MLIVRIVTMAEKILPSGSFNLCSKEGWCYHCNKSRMLLGVIRWVSAFASLVYTRPRPTFARLNLYFSPTASKFSEALSDHVLGEFTRTENKVLDNVIADACDAVEHWIEEEDMAKVMTRFNSAR